MDTAVMQRVEQIITDELVSSTFAVINIGKEYRDVLTAIENSHSEWRMQIVDATDDYTTVFFYDRSKEHLHKRTFLEDLGDTALETFKMLRK